MIHKRDLLPWLVRDVKVSLKMKKKNFRLSHKSFVASRMMAYLVDDEIQPVNEVLWAPLELDERSHVVRNVLATQVSG